MKIKPVIADSLGARSMATFVELEKFNIFIDPGVSLAPKRYGLEPHKKEIEVLNKSWNEIVKLMKKVKIAIITHYHYDHYNPEAPEIFKDKILLLKDPEKENLSQKRRGSKFIKEVKEYAKEIIIADGQEFKFENVKIKFSEPVFHGTNKKLGYVIEVFIKEGKDSFLFTSDVEGPSVEEQVEFILKNKAKIIYVDGPLSYMLGYRYSYEALEKSNENLIRICKKVKPDKIIIDHHLLRDLKWEERIKKAIEECKNIICAATFLNKKINMLEALRKELYAS